MTIEEFWNAAFLASLSRLPVAAAKKEADKATEVCIDHWHANCLNWSPENMPRVQDVDIAHVLKPGDGHGNVKTGAFGLRADNALNKPTSNATRKRSSAVATRRRPT